MPRLYEKAFRTFVNEVRAAQDGSRFRTFENGKKVSTYWPRYNPQQLSGSEPRMTIQEAFERSLGKKFADYTVTNLIVGKRN